MDKMKKNLGWFALQFLGQSVAFLSAAYLLFHFTYEVWMRPPHSLPLFAVGLACAALAVWVFLSISLIKKVRREMAITRIVGMHPDQIARWKWKNHARKVVIKKLGTMASGCQAVDKEETSLEEVPLPDWQKIQQVDREMRRRLKEFRETYDLASRYGLDLPKASWNDWVFPAE